MRLVKVVSVMVVMFAVSFPVAAQQPPMKEQKPAPAKVQKPSAGLEERYYVVLFCSEGTPNIPRLSHGFATFAKKTTGAGVDEFEDFTISWMPANLNCQFRLRPEPGVNLDLPGTFEYVKSVNGRAFAWGPYEINKELYDRAVAQFKRLEEGKQLYKMVDFRMKYRPTVANNCYHSVTDIAPTDLVATGTLFGEPMGPAMVQHFRPWLVNPEETHDWVSEQLGLRQFEVRFRRMEFPSVIAETGGN